MKKLLIDTSTNSLVIILIDNDFVIDYIFEMIEKDHSRILMPKIAGLLQRNSLDINDIGGIIVANGPGSYTGLRIGVTVAKTLSYTLKLPLYKISTLRLMSASFINQAKYLVPLIDARRKNVFSCLFKVENNKLVLILDEKLYCYEVLLTLVKQHVKQEKVCFITDKANDLYIENEQFQVNLLQDYFNPQLISNLAFIPVTNIHSFVPDYKRQTEAEMNLK